MGRKNRNARSRSYTSFNDLKATTVRFDLSKGDFKTRGRGHKHATNTDEIGFSIITNGSLREKNACFSVRSDLSDKMRNSYGEYWTCGIVTEGVFERLYLIPAKDGFKLVKNPKGTRNYLKVPITGDVTCFERYDGYHELQFDEYNDAYFITVNK